MEGTQSSSLDDETTTTTTAPIIPNNNNNVVGIIFLDIDGVLLPFPNDVRTTKDKEQSLLFPKGTLDALNRLLYYTKAKLVLSSTWRVQEKYQEDILDCFEQYAQFYHSDTTTTSSCPLGEIAQSGTFWGITNPKIHTERQWEIYDWLSIQPHTVTMADKEILWLVLDDEELINGTKNERYRTIFEGHVIHVQSSIGLTQQNVDYGIQLWNEQITKLTTS